MYRRSLALPCSSPPRPPLCRIGIALVTALSIFVLVWSAELISTDINPHGKGISSPPRRRLRSKLEVVYPLWYGQVLRTIRRPLINIPFGSGYSSAAKSANEDQALMLPARVALMVLTPGPMPLTELWRQWFDDAAGLVPTSYVDHLHTTMSFDDARAAVEKAQQHMVAALADDQSTVLERQWLFSVYMHTHPNYTMHASHMFAANVRGRGVGGVFHSTCIYIPRTKQQVIENRIVARRMYHSLTEATKLLLQAALLEPLNNRFVLLSETHVPLYPPGLVYLQLQTEQVSRMDGCNFFPLRIKVL